MTFPMPLGLKVRVDGPCSLSPQAIVPLYHAKAHHIVRPHILFATRPGRSLIKYTIASYIVLRTRDRGLTPHAA